MTFTPRGRVRKHLLSFKNDFMDSFTLRTAVRLKRWTLEIPEMFAIPVALCVTVHTLQVCTCIQSPRGSRVSRFQLRRCCQMCTRKKLWLSKTCTNFTIITRYDCIQYIVIASTSTNLLKRFTLTPKLYEYNDDDNDHCWRSCRCCLRCSRYGDILPKYIVVLLLDQIRPPRYSPQIPNRKSQSRRPIFLGYDRSLFLLLLTIQVLKPRYIRRGSWLFPIIAWKIVNQTS